MTRWDQLHYMDEIELTDEHRKLAERMHFRFDDESEWGVPGLDAKRPFGNSGMPDDVAEILGWDIDEDGLMPEQYERAKQLHFEMGYVLKAAVSDWLA